MGFNFIVVSSINSLDGLDVLEFAIIKGSFNDISEINLDLAVLKIGNSSQSMFHPVFIISLLFMKNKEVELVGVVIKKVHILKNNKRNFYHKSFVKK